MSALVLTASFPPYEDSPMRTPKPPSLESEVARRARDDVLLMFVATSSGRRTKTTVDSIGRPIELTVYLGAKRVRVPIRWKGDVMYLSPRSRKTLERLFIPLLAKMRGV